MKNTKHTIAENIRFYRRQKKLRQKDIAEYFNISDSAVSMWECGENMMNADMFFELADYLGVTPDALAGRAPSGVTFDEMEMIRKYRALSHETQIGVSGMISAAYETTKKGSVNASAS